MDGTERGAGEGRKEWSLSPTWTRIGTRSGRVLMYLLFGAGYLCDVAAIGSVAWMFFLPTLLIAVPLGRIVHELGRYVAAHCSGMVVAVMRIGPVDISPRRRGWRFRWKRHIHPGSSAYVYAVPDPALPLRPAMIRFALGGAVATTVFAVLVALTIPFFPSEVSRWSVAAVAAVLLTPLSSFFPKPLTTATPMLESGSVMVWRWWQHPPGDAWMARTMASSRMLRGTPISAFGGEDLDMLLDQPLVGIWLAVKRHQQCGEWLQATELSSRLNDRLPVHRYAKSVFAELIDLIRSEMAFSAAVVHRDPSWLPTPDALRRSRWGDAPLHARCEAWRAHLAGDGEACWRSVDECIRIADNSVDRSLVASERLIAARLYGEIHISP